MSSLEIQYVESEVVSCDGGVGALGHPRVWLNMEGVGEIFCPYCNRHFILKKSPLEAPEKKT